MTSLKLGSTPRKLLLASPHEIAHNIRGCRDKPAQATREPIKLLEYADESKKSSQRQDHLPHPPARGAEEEVEYLKNCGMFYTIRLSFAEGKLSVRRYQEESTSFGK